MVLGLGKKKEAPQQIVKPSGVPTDKVLEMRSQNISNNQIIEALQREGYEMTSIFNAMNQADIKSGVDYGNLGPEGFGSAQQAPTAPSPNDQMSAGMSPQPLDASGPAMGPAPEQMGPGTPMTPMGDPTAGPMDMGQMDPGMAGAPIGQPMQEPMGPSMGGGMAPPMQQPMDAPMQGPSMGPGPMGPGMQGPQPVYGGTGFEAQRIEELAEAIIDEKWNEIVRSINKIIDWKERVEGRVTRIEQQLVDMQKNFDMLHKGVLGKISDYDHNLTNVGAEIKAMEKVFQKVLPTLTENVSELSRITGSMRKK